MKPLGLLTTTAAACCFMIPIGYEFGIQNVVYSSHFNLTGPEWTGFSIAWPLGTLLGSLVSPPVADRFSRKFSVFVIPSLFLLTGGILTTFTRVWTLILGRLVFGMGSGLVMSILPMYMAEIAGCSLIGGLMNSGFWFGTAMASGLGLDTVLGGQDLWSYFALIAPFLICMTLILSPLFPEVPEPGPSEESMLLVESRPQAWSWKHPDCRKLGIVSVLVGMAWTSMGPLVLFTSSRAILTSSKLSYSVHVAGAIEGCVATIYACLALLSITLMLLGKLKKPYMVITCFLAAFGFLCALMFVLLAQYNRITGWTAKMGFLFSFLICTIAYQTVLTPTFFTAPYLYCTKAHWRLRCYSLLNIGAWFAYLIWALAFPQLAQIAGGWSLLPFLVTFILLALGSYVYWKRQEPRVYGGGRASFFASTSSSESKVSIGYGSFGERAKSDLLKL